MRSAEGLKDRINNNRDDGSALLFAPPHVPGAQEGIAAIQQATLLLTRLVQGLQGIVQLPQLGTGAPHGVVQQQLTPIPPPLGPSLMPTAEYLIH